MIKAELSDFVMLQVMGGLDSFAKDFDSYSQEEFDHLVAVKRSKTTVPNLYRGIVDKAIRGQFGFGDAYLRELTQNAGDASPQYFFKTIEFTTREEDDKLLLTVRDTGKGMSTYEVIKDLLIPHNSVKKGDLTKNGENGLGFFSVFDIAEKVQVKTGNGKTTYADLCFEDGKWMSYIQTENKPFLGTEITLQIPKTITDNQELEQQLGKYVGFLKGVDTEVLFNGKQINTAAKEYTHISSANVLNKGVEGEFKFSIKYDPTMYESNFIITQNGLFVSDMYRYEEGLYKNIADLITDSGFTIWQDLPRNIGLTKGRNGIVAGDQDAYGKACTSAFEEAVLHMFLSNKYVDKFDTRLVDLIDNILENTYKSKLPNNEIHGKDYFELKRNGSLEDRVDDTKKEFFLELQGFAKKLVNSNVILAMKKNGRKIDEKSVSLNDVAMAYVEGNVYDINQECIDDGLYVNLKNYAIQAIMSYIDKNKEKWGGLSGASKNTGFLINRTPLNVFEQIKEGNGIGDEYVSFLQITGYIDKLISEATGMACSDVMLHKDMTAISIAHTDHTSISFNLSSNYTQKWFDEICKGSMDENYLDKLLEVMLHEKAHISRGIFDEKAAHNRTFYSIKRQLRATFIKYCLSNGIDPIEKINNEIIKSKLEKRTAADDLTILIDDYTNS